MKKSEKKIIEEFKALPSESYQKMDLDRLALRTLCILEDNDLPLYFDYAAVAMFKLFPKKFSMASFPKYPDTNRINKSLRRLTDQVRRGWATGSVENGFNITELGQEIGNQVRELIENPERQKEGSLPTRSRGRSPIVATNELKKSEAFKKWVEMEPITNYEFFAFLKAAPYTPKPLLLEHIERLKSAAVIAGDEEVVKFLGYMEEEFEKLIK